MHSKLFFLLFLMAVFACNSPDGEQSTQQEDSEDTKEFDKDKWKSRDDTGYTYRADMIDDVLYNDTVRSLSRTEVLALFGEPDRINELYFYYTISQKKLGFWPLHSKTMVIKFQDENTIEWIKVHE